MRLQLARPSPSVSLNVTLFPASPTPVTLKSLGRHIATSGPYIDSISGVVTPLTIFQPGNYLILPSTFQEGVEEVFKIEVFSTVAGVKVQLRKRWFQIEEGGGWCAKGLCLCDMRNSLTRLRVDLEGFASGRLVIIHWRRVRIEVLSIFAALVSLVWIDNNLEKILHAWSFVQRELAKVVKK